MSTVLLNLALNFCKRTPKIMTPIRIIPAPKSFALRINWEATAKQPIVIPVRMIARLAKKLQPPENAVIKSDRKPAMTSEVIL